MVCCETHKALEVKLFHIYFFFCFGLSSLGKARKTQIDLVQVWALLFFSYIMVGIAFKSETQFFQLQNENNNNNNSNNSPEMDYRDCF